MLKELIYSAVIISPLAAACAKAPQADVPTSNLQPHFEVTWLGGPTVTFEFNGLSIVTDPTFGGGAEAFSMGDPNEMFDLRAGPNIKFHKRLTAPPAIDPGSIDLVMLSHAHEDHFDQKAQAALNPAVSMILPSADAGKVKAMGFKNVDSLSWGDRRVFKAGPGQVTIVAVNAHHSENPDMEKFLGVGNGYWIEFSQGDWKRTVYWTGDSFPTSDVIDAVKKLGRVDILMPHLGGVGTSGPLGLISMRADDVVRLADSLSPRKVLPIHHSTYELYLEPISALVVKSERQAYGLDLISEGATIAYR